jgi:hypothetical protein
MNTKTIETMAKELSEKNSWIRKSWKDIMTTFSEIKTDDIVEVCVYKNREIDEYNRSQYLRLGEDDLFEDIGFGPDNRETETSYRYTWDCFPVHTLRKLIKEMPGTIKKLEEIMKNKSIGNEQCQTIIEKFKS